MSEQWKYQIRIYLDGDLAEAARFDPGSQKLKWLSSVLAKHRAKLRCQFDLFAEYVAEAERVGTEVYHLYEWTRATIEDPIKRAKYVESFSLYVGDQEVYAKEISDALGVMPLVESGQIKKYQNMIVIRQTTLSHPREPRDSRRILFRIGPALLVRCNDGGLRCQSASEWWPPLSASKELGRLLTGWDAFSVVLLLTPHPPDAAQHTGSFVEPNILLGAASACQTLYDRSWRILLI